MLAKKINLIIVLVLFSASAIWAATAPQNNVTSKIVVDFAVKGKKISPLLYGNNTKWLSNGEASGGKDNGIWSLKKNDVNPKLKDILTSSGITILRYGDGTNADYFYWGWSLLPIKERLKQKLYTRWGKNENYGFGLIEYIKLARTMKCESIIIVNYGMGILRKFYDKQQHHDSRTELEIAIQQAANLVEFMNIVAPENNSKFPKTYRPEYSLQKMPQGYFAYLRAQLGSPKPLNVKYWEIGNEIYCFHRSGTRAIKKGWMPVVKATSMSEYTKNAFKFSQAMKAVDPTIKTGLVEYKKKLIEQVALAKSATSNVDFIIPHDYIRGNQLGKNPVYTFYGAGMHRKFFFPQSGTYTLNISAWSRAYFGDKYPNERGIPTKLAVQVDGKKVGVIALNKNIDIAKAKVDKKFYNYSLKLKLNRGEHDIYLYHCNDFIDKTFNDVNRRGRDAYADKIYITGYGKNFKLINGNSFAAYYSQLPKYFKKISEYSDTVKDSKLFLAQTESAVFPSPANLSAALCEAIMIMEDIKYGIAIRNHWHLYGSCKRGGVIHSGVAKEKKDHYHCTPSYYVIQLFSQFFGNQMVKSLVKVPQIKLRNIARKDGDEGKQVTISAIYAIAAQSKTGQLTIAIVNCHHKNSVKLALEIKNFKTQTGFIHTLQAKIAQNYKADNEKLVNNVKVTKRVLSKPIKSITVAPNSLTIITINQ